jgi:hypothetical protein
MKLCGSDFKVLVGNIEDESAIQAADGFEVLGTFLLTM